jgi:hypothetical protein
MPRHADTMAARLPLLYRDGELVRQLLALPGLALEIFDEDAAEVRRAHLFDAALEREEAARLAAVLDIAPEPWQDLGEFRAWVHALRDALVGEGAVTVPAMHRLVGELVGGFASATGVEAVPPLDTWSEEPSPRAWALIENPEVFRFQRVPAAGALVPLSQFEIENRGLDESAAGLLIVGAGASGEYVPVIVNVTTGDALVFRGHVPPGARLFIRAQPDGLASARLETDDVTGQLYSVTGVVPGQPWTPAAATKPARALPLARGKNHLWFLPVAHYDDPGLDRFLAALPDLLVEQGVFDRSALDRALFVQDPGAYLYAAWRETEPASFRIELPAPTLRSTPGALTAALAARDKLALALGQAVDRVRAAGVKASARLTPARDVQFQSDAVRVMPILRFAETGPTGGDRLREGGGAFELTDFDDSTFR